MGKIKTIAFDADDTLWVNETLFIDTRLACETILAPYVAPEQLEEKLYQTEIKNLQYFGYGIKGFVLSMIETAIQLSYGNITGQEIQQIIEMGKDMVQKPIQILPHVRQTLEKLFEDYELMIITKGDLFDQESKIARSGLSDYFKRIEIVSEKSVESYKKILTNYQINPGEFLMVGNSLKSDILPVCELNALAVHIPFHTTWEYEKISDQDHGHIHYFSLKDLSQLPKFLGEFHHNGN